MVAILDDRPEVLEGTTYKRHTPCGNLYVTVNSTEGNPTEVLCQLGKSGGCASAWVTTMARVLSVALQNGVPIKKLQKQLVGVTCFNQVNTEELGCIHQIAKALEENINSSGGGDGGGASP